MQRGRTRHVAYYRFLVTIRSSSAGCRCILTQAKNNVQLMSAPEGNSELGNIESRGNSQQNSLFPEAADIKCFVI